MSMLPWAKKDGNGNGTSIDRCDGFRLAGYIAKKPVGRSFGSVKTRYLVLLRPEGYQSMNGCLKYYADEDAFASMGTPLGSVTLDHTSAYTVLGKQLAVRTFDRRRNRQTSLLFVVEDPDSPSVEEWYQELTASASSTSDRSILPHARNLSADEGHGSSESSEYGNAHDGFTSPSMDATTHIEMKDMDGSGDDDTGAVSFAAPHETQREKDSVAAEATDVDSVVMKPTNRRFKRASQSVMTAIRMRRQQKTMAAFSIEDTKLEGHHSSAGAAHGGRSYYRRTSSKAARRRRVPLKCEMLSIIARRMLVKNGALPAHSMWWQSLRFRLDILTAARRGDLTHLKGMLWSMHRGVAPLDEECLRHVMKSDVPNCLRAAVRFSRKEVIEYLLDEEGVDVNVENDFNSTPIFFIAVNGESQTEYEMESTSKVEILHLLVSRGADVMHRNMWGQTMLYWLATHPDEEWAISIIKILTKPFVRPRGSSLDESDVDNRPDLISGEGGEEVMEEPLVDPRTERDLWNGTPLHYAALFGRLKTVMYLEQISVGYEQEEHYPCESDESETRFVPVREQFLKSIDTYTQNFASLLPGDPTTTVRNWRRQKLLPYAKNLSPLGVAILYNEIGTAKFLSGDGANIRCRRRQSLFHRSNLDLRLLAKTMPHMLEQVLDGFVIDRVVEGGFENLSVDLMYLMGCPNVPVRHIPLAVFLRADWNPIWEHEVTQLVVDVKWSQFGIERFWREAIPYLTLVTFTLGLAFSRRSDEPVWRWLAVINSMMLLVKEEGREFLNEGFARYFSSIWNVCSLSCYVLIISILPLDLVYGYGENHSEYVNGTRKLCLTPAVFFLTIRLLEFLQILPTTNKFISMIGLMLSDISQWSIIFILFETTFALSFYVLLGDLGVGFDSLLESLVTTFAMTLGDFDLPFVDDPDEYRRNAMAITLFVILTFIVVIAYVNLLIAMMSTSYELIDKQARVEAVKSLARALIKWETVLTLKQRKHHWKWIKPPHDPKADEGMQRHLTHSVLPAWIGMPYEKMFGGWIDREMTCFRDHVRVLNTLDMSRYQAEQDEHQKNQRSSVLPWQSKDGKENQRVESTNQSHILFGVGRHSSVSVEGAPREPNTSPVPTRDSVQQSTGVGVSDAHPRSSVAFRDGSVVVSGGGNADTNMVNQNYFGGDQAQDSASVEAKLDHLTSQLAVLTAALATLAGEEPFKTASGTGTTRRADGSSEAGAPSNRETPSGEENEEEKAKKDGIADSLHRQVTGAIHRRAAKMRSHESISGTGHQEPRGAKKGGA